MKQQGGDKDIELVAISRIRVMNPRVRDQRKFKRIVENIARVGLKKPITVCKRSSSTDAEPLFDLVCGQGRLEAYIALGETMIPARVVAAEKEDRLIMSLVENLARRQPATFEHVRQIVRLRDEGYSAMEIGEKVDLSDKYILGLLKLWDNCEERLISGVEAGRIPLSMAVAMCHASDQEEQRLLAEAYESKKLMGNRLLAAKRLLEQRRDRGKGLKPVSGKNRSPASADALVRTYEQEVGRQRMFVKKARLCETRLLFVVSATRKLLADDNFVNLLRAEQLDTLPRYLAEEAGLEE